MTNLPTRDAILDNQIITSDWKTYYGNIRDFISQMLGGAEPEVCIIMEESISPSKAVIALDLDELVSESLLKNIDITNYPTSQWIFLILNNPEKKITLAHGQPGDGAIYTFSQQNEQVSESDVIVLRRNGNNWQQVDLFSYARATDEELDEGTSKFKSPTVAQLRPYLSNATSSAMGVVVYALRKPEGTLKCDQTEYQLDTFPQLAEYLKGGQLPTTTFEDYASQSSSNGFCEKFALDEDSGKFKCPNLESQKIGETTYNAYVAVYNTVTAESLIQLQGILDQCLSVQVAINEKGEEITNYVNSSLQELESKKDEYLQNIKDQEVSSLEVLTSATNTHIGELDDKKDICIAEVEAKRDEITNEGQAQIDRVIQTGNSQVTYVQQTGADVIADSRTWATGEDIEVNELEEGEHSSRGYADLSAAFAETDEDIPIADSPLMALQSIAGPKGDRGDAGTISVGTVTTGNAGTNAIITNVGTTNDAVFNFVIPKGDKGDRGEKGGSNIGDIYYTSRTDVPSGGAWCDGEEYTQAQFPDIYQMLVDGKLQSLSYEEYQQQVSANGFCEFFALDTETQKFKVQTIPDGAVIGLKNNIPVVGTGKNLGLQSIGQGGLAHIAGNWIGPSKEINVDTGTAINVASTSDFPDNKAIGVTTDPTKSGIIADTSNAAKTIAIKYYVVLYSSAAEASVAQAAEFINGLANKANTDLSNVNPIQSFKETSISWGMPDYGLGVEKSTEGFIADKDGLVMVECWASSSYIEAKIDGVVVALWKTSVNDVADRGTKSFSISKGEKLTFDKQGSAIVKKVIFFPFKGVN